MTVAQLAAKSEDELLAIDGIGPASIDDIKAKLSDLGLTLGQPRAAAARPRTRQRARQRARPGGQRCARCAVPHAAAARHVAQQLRTRPSTCSRWPECPC